MEAFVIQGGKPLRGTVRIHGSKNAALPLMAAALLTDQPVTLTDVPALSDIRNLARLLEALGCRVGGITPSAPLPQRSQPDDAGDADSAAPGSEGQRVALHTTDESEAVSTAPYEIVRTMRAGICVLGPLLARRGHAKVSLPGGCAIGDRPVNLHLRGLRALGAKIEMDGGYIVAEGPAGKGSRLRAAHVFLGGPNGSTVLGTANVMSAATLAEGTTVIEAAACEPEVADLAVLLNAMGAKITGAGTPWVTIEGVGSLNGTPGDGHRVMADRIEAGTYVCAAAITNGDVRLENFPTATLTAALDRLAEVGVELDIEQPSDQRLRDTVRIVSRRVLKPVQVVTQPHPGFPTDLQAQVMALLCLADGNSMVTEKIFPDRFLHVPELLRMGANITRMGTNALVTGTRELIGAPVMASDLRASAGLVLAGLAARGETVVHRVYHLDRGYERMERTLQRLGADIAREDRDAV